MAFASRSHTFRINAQVAEITKGTRKTTAKIVEEVFINLSTQSRVDVADSEKELLREKLATKLNEDDKRYNRAFCASALANASSYRAKPTLDDVMLAYNWVGDVPAGFEGTSSEYYGGLVDKIINEYNDMMKAYA